jgi:hypothetical protein
MKKNKILFFLFTFLSVYGVLQSCKTPQSISDKSGALLWSENCQRCHNLPTPTLYIDDQWEILGRHMRVRANLTPDETQKIVAFLQSSN